MSPTCSSTWSRTGPSRWISRTRSPREAASRMAARSSTSAPSSYWNRRNEQRAAQRADLLRAVDLRRHRGHLQGADHPAHTFDVRDQRDSRHHPRGRDRHRGRGELAREHHPGARRGHPRDDQRRRWFRGHRPDARDVQRPERPEAIHSDQRIDSYQVTTLIEIAYLVAAVCFILGLKQLTSPKGARTGNCIAAVGMVIALLATLPLLHFTTAGVIIIAIGVVIGAAIRSVGPPMVHMTAIP